ncbi:MAG: HEAT repeat domain-containing protein [Planctomycetaceae bacterium]|nr:HEAT repeat domain-containing protein [Planctomycetaceae bacterium]
MSSSFLRWCRTLSLLAALLTSIPGSAAAQQVKLVADTEPLTAAEQQTKFHLPPGFKIELVAAEPDVPKPININFDRHRRMLVTCSTEYPFAAPPDRPHHDTIRLITDANGDALFDKVRVSTFAKGLNIPIGVVGVPGGVIGYSIPNIYRFPDSNDDGEADEKILAYGVFGSGDTHGMSSSYNYHIDGWVYACHGFSNTSTVKGADGKSFTMSSGNTYRFKPDGSHIEQWTHGQVNPFGMTIDHRGDIFTADCHTKPITMLLRGGQYPMFGKPHDGLGFAPGIMEHGHESTGIAGVAFYDADMFPKDYRHNLFIGNPVTGRINRDVLEYKGSSPTAIGQPDFLTCDDPWFRPVDIRLGPDGALYVADFYNRIIGHYEVPLTHPQRDRERGRIWRISYVGEGDTKPQATPSPDITKADAEELVKALGHPNILVRNLATHELTDRVGKEAAKPLKSIVLGDPKSKDPGTGSEQQRVHGLWVLHRLGALDSSARVKLSFDPSPLVRLHLVKSIAELGDNSPNQMVVAWSLTQDPDPFVRRAVLDAMGRHPEKDLLLVLLMARDKADPADAQLVHTARMALRESLLKEDSLADLSQRLVGKLGRIAEILLDVAPGVHTTGSARFLLGQHASKRLPDDKAADLVQHIGRYGDEAAQQDLDELALRTIERTENDEAKRSLLRAMHRVRQEKGKSLTEALLAAATEQATKLLQSGDEGTVRRGLELVRELALKSSRDNLAKLATPGSKHPNVQPDAWDALAAIDREAAFPVIAAVLASNDSRPEHRQRAVDSLGAFNTAESRTQLVALLKVLPQSQALGIARALSGSKEGADALLTAIEKGLTSPRVLLDLTVTKKLEASGVPDREKRVGALTQGLPPEDERIGKLIAARLAAAGNASADAGRGRKIFEKSCAACHKIGTLGAKVGPELEGIGIRGPARLLEDVLDPNRNVDAAFRASILSMKDGRVLTGLVLREEGKTLVFVDDKGKEQRVSADDVEERKLVKLSPMPANVAETIPEADFHDLLRFLLDQKQKPKP